MSSFISEVNSCLKNEIKLFGKVKDMVYTFTCDGLLTFFQKDAFITAKINFPSCEILQW